MEKIQEAIAKARASRGSGSTTVSGKAALAADHHPQNQPIREAWAALQRIEPDPAHLQKQRVITAKGGHESAAFDALRTKTLQVMRANNWRRLAITSPTPRCGKSTTILNLAFSLARQSELRTIVTDLDLRSPSLSRLLGTPPGRSFVDLYEERAAFEDQGMRYHDNLAFSLSSGPVRNPAELLSGEGIEGTLVDIERRYEPDLMLFDTPPILACDDMMAFAGHVDCVLLVAAAEQTTIKEIDNCERELARQTNVMGVVLNKCRYMGREYGYSYYA
ncbi:MAG: CpsD/CapB family tyrosine-protein kinase [Pseudorhodobacter sp.]